MSKRHEKIGIKQGLRIEWLDYALNLRLSGMSFPDMRAELISYMSTRLDNGERGERGKTTTQIAVSMLSNIWGKVNPEIEPLQKHALHIEKKNTVVLHWAMLCAAYPFWYKIAQQTGRLLNLQEETNKRQIIQRVKEIYGDRSSVIRSAQRVVQGFLGCHVLDQTKNNQLKLAHSSELDTESTILLCEAALYAKCEGRSPLESLKNDPAFFPFQLAILTGDHISQHSNVIDVVRYGLDDELLKLKKT